MIKIMGPAMRNVGYSIIDNSTIDNSTVCNENVTMSIVNGII